MEPVPLKEVLIGKDPIYTYNNNAFFYIYTLEQQKKIASFINRLKFIINDINNAKYELFYMLAPK